MKKPGEPFFVIMAVFMIAIVVVGFGGVALQLPGGPLGLPALLHLHGAVFLSWYVLFAAQASLISAGRVRTHMTLGAASIVLALAMITLGYLATRHAYGRPDWSIAGLPRGASAIFPFTDIFNFTIVYTLALTTRLKDAAAHKRLMLAASILIIDAAVARLMFVIGAPPPFALGVEGALFAALFIYDWRSLKRIHWASLLAFALFALALAAKFTIATTPWWNGFAETLYG